MEEETKEAVLSPEENPKRLKTDHSHTTDKFFEQSPKSSNVNLATIGCQTDGIKV